MTRKRPGLADLPDVLTVEQYGAFLGVGRNQAYQSVRRGDVSSIRLGSRTIRIPKAALIALVEGGRPPD